MLKVLLTLSVLAAGSAYAQSHPHYPDYHRDELKVTQNDYSAEVYYYNSVHKNSQPREEQYDNGALSFSVSVEIGTGTPEVLSVTVNTPGYEVIPQDTIPVEDGDNVTIYIIPVTG